MYNVHCIIVLLLYCIALYYCKSAVYYRNLSFSISPIPSAEELIFSPLYKVMFLYHISHFFIYIKRRMPLEE